MERTTDLIKVMKGAPFSWGEVLEVWVIGEYAIIAYHPWKVEKSNVKTGNPDLQTTQYHGYVHQKSISESFESLDAALAGCIAYKHEGPNHRAGYYFIKMIIKRDG